MRNEYDVPLAPIDRVGNHVEPGQCRIMLGGDDGHDVYLILGPAASSGMWHVLTVDKYHGRSHDRYKPEVTQSTDAWLRACELLEDL